MMSKKNKYFFLLFLCATIFLNVCSYAEQDFQTAPNKKLITLEQKMKASPALSKVKTYHQYGKYYRILPSSKNFEEKGVASWYGSQFHLKRTSSGERFNMYQLTAAHKTLPLPTRVLVTNLTNGRKVIVRVNDRGPFISNRIIDLSYAAAKQLNMVGRGIAPVSIKAIN